MLNKANPLGGHGWSWSVTVGHRFSDPKIDGHLMGQQIGGHKKNYPSKIYGL